MIEFISKKFIDYPDLDKQAKVRKVLLFISLLLLFIHHTNLTYRLLEVNYDQGIVEGLSAIFAVLGIYFVFRKAGYFIPTLIIAFYGLINISFAVWTNGGIYSSESAWYFITGIALILFLDRKIGIYFFLFGFGFVLIVAYLQSSGIKDFSKDVFRNGKDYGIINIITLFSVMTLNILLAFSSDKFLKNWMSSKENKITDLEKELAFRMNEINNLKQSLAEDFHDILGNKLAASISISQMLEEKLAKNEYNSQIKQLNTLGKEIYATTKDFIWSLNFENSTPIFIYSYLNEFAERFFSFGKIDFYSMPFSEFEKEVKISAYTTTQLIVVCKELFTNVLNHSQATTVEFYLGYNSSSMDLIIKDNGIGFNFSELKRINGLKNIQARCDKAKIKLDFKAKTPTGTIVSLKYLI